MSAAKQPSRQTLVTSDIGAIASVIRGGGVVAYPTEAVFGLGCRPSDATACERVLALKNRVADKGLIVITDDLSRIAYWLEPVPSELQARAEATWPGPHTWLWPARASCPPWLRGAHTQLAVRVTAHPGVRALCAASGSALVSTSANLSGEPPCRESSCVQSAFDGQIDAILDLRCAGADAPSTIRDIRTGAWIRGGPEITRNPNRPAADRQ